MIIKKRNDKNAPVLNTSNKTKDQKTFDFLSEENNVKNIIKATSIFTLCLLLGIGALLFWSWNGNIEESISGAGELVPTGKLRRVMSPINGLVYKVHVKEAERVKKGQILAKLDPELSSTRRSGYGREKNYVEQEVFALKSAAEGSINSFTSSETQNAWLKSSQQAYQAKLESTNLRIKKAEYLYQNLNSKALSLKKLLASNRDILSKYERLFDGGGISKNEVELQRQKVLEQEGELASTIEKANAHKTEAAEAKQERKELKASYKEKILSRLLEHEKNLIRVNSEFEQSDINLKHQTVNAPIDGIINERFVHGKGEVVQMGAPLFSIVPNESELVAEVRLLNKDLSFVKLNQPVNVMIDALPYQRFGKITGVIQSLSPSTQKDEKGEPFYIAIIRLDKQTVKKDKQVYKLKAGMTFNANIITKHKKRVLSFLTEPIERQLDRAFRDPSNR